MTIRATRATDRWGGVGGSGAPHQEMDIAELVAEALE
jgi:hypothetical protein